MRVICGLREDGLDRFGVDMQGIASSCVMDEIRFRQLLMDLTGHVNMEVIIKTSGST